MGKDIKACEPDKNKPPPVGRACGVCPKCRAACTVDPPPTEAEKEVKQLAVKLEHTQISFKRKITECAMLRADVQQSKEEADRERAATRETVGRLRELEQRFDALSEHAHALLRNKEQTLGQDSAVRALKLCYREAREEVDELRALLADQAVQLQDYRAKAQQAAQLVEEQKKQLVALDMDNTRIAEQINLEIQSIKVKFQERLQELAPLPDKLHTAQRKLQAAQQATALAQHAAVHTAQDLDSARERVRLFVQELAPLPDKLRTAQRKLQAASRPRRWRSTPPCILRTSTPYEQVNTLVTHAKLKPPERPMERGNDEKLLAMTQQRVTQLTEMNATLKGEIERQKVNVLRLEEAVVTCERRLQEKMHECAALGGELDRAREDASLAVLRAHQHEQAVRKCMETTVAAMQGQLAEVRAQLEVIEKERESTKCRMQCQLQRLQQNCEVAEMRALGLQAQSAALRRGAGDDEDGAEEAPDCDCDFQT